MNNEEQIAYWNGEGGERWARTDETMARLLRPVAQALLDTIPEGEYRSALDVGCGGGSQSLLLAERLGPGASVLGVDVSGPMLEVARRRPVGEGCAAVDFLRADAAEYDFAGQHFDLLFSRFGVMFFDDPPGAFANLRRATRAGGRLVFCCWQALQDNEWVRLPLQAALQHVPPPPPVEPHAPGPFAFADAARVESILAGAGFGDIAVEPKTMTLRFSETPSLLDSARELAAIGPVSRLLAERDEATLEQVHAAVAEVLAPAYRDNALALEGAMWFVSAGVPSG